MESLFRLTSAYPLPLWLAMILAPRHPWTERASRSSFLLGGAAVNYILALFAALRGNGQDQMPDFSSLEGIRQGLSTPPGALAAWNHMVALDLFTGAWIYRQSRRLNAPAWVRIPALLLTFVTGPLGLLFFLLWRAVGSRQGEALPGFTMGQQ